MNASTFIDLFCGCGGFTLGMLRAGFRCKAAIDFNPHAVATLKANLADRTHPGFPAVEYALERDLTQFPPAELEKLIGSRQVDVIVGGPPCQGFSTARQRDGSNHGTERLKDDPRRHLYRQFLNYVEYFQPKIFVIENVLGLRSAAGGQYFTAVQHEARILGRHRHLAGYRVHSQIEDATDLGVPQKRRRQLIIGVRADLPGYFPSDLRRASRVRGSTNLGEAIMDLPVLRAGGGENVSEYSRERRLGFIRRAGPAGRRYLYKVCEVARTKKLTNHVARPHSERDLRDFKLLSEGESSAVLLRRGVEFEFPYDKTTFKDRYTRQHRQRPCSTIVAHLSKDGLMFIHPTQNRSLTPREAARVQSFPDWFVFPDPRTHAFRLIGNAVPPLIGEAVGDAVRSFLRSLSESAVRKDTALPRSSPSIPASMEQAATRLQVLMHCNRGELRTLDAAAFINGWHALLWLFPGLHPNNALDHGVEQHDWPEAETVLPGIDPTKRQVNVRSGWPVALVLIGEEAWRRFGESGFTENDFYSAEAQSAGMRYRKIESPRAFDPADRMKAVF